MMLAASLLGANQSSLEHDLQLVQPFVDFFHIDIMDGQFVPNFGFGSKTVADLRKLKKPLEVHLMVLHPEKHIHLFAKAGAHIITVHAEAVSQLSNVLRKIKQHKCKAGVALSPNTPLEVLKGNWHLLDYLLFMGVQPGFGGQQFIQTILPKITQAKDYINEKNLSVLVAVDGGINLRTGKQCKKAGADVLITGSSLFRAKNIVSQAKKFKKIK